MSRSAIRSAGTPFAASSFMGLMHRIIRAPNTSPYTGTSAVRVTAGTSGSVPQKSITRRRSQRITPCNKEGGLNVPSVPLYLDSAGSAHFQLDDHERSNLTVPQAAKMMPEDKDMIMTRLVAAQQGHQHLDMREFLKMQNKAVGGGSKHRSGVVNASRRAHRGLMQPRKGY